LHFNKHPRRGGEVTRARIRQHESKCGGADGEHASTRGGADGKHASARTLVLATLELAGMQTKRMAARAPAWPPRLPACNALLAGLSPRRLDGMERTERKGMATGEVGGLERVGRH
jgi:hypothetical protein